VKRVKKLKSNGESANRIAHVFSGFSKYTVGFWNTEVYRCSVSKKMFETCLSYKPGL